MPRFCASCGAQVADAATFCPGCGQPAGAPASSGTSAAPTQSAAPAPAPVAVSTGQPTTGLADNVAGMLAYITIIPAIIFLVMEPYNKRPFVKFHAFQSIFFCVAWIVLSIVLSIIGMIPFLGLVTLLLWPLLGLAGLAVWVILLVKANSGQMYKLPVIGDLAEKQANAA